ncbi:TonB-dependent receptor plug domain-containing protein [Pseudoxanthomonas sp. LARHCG66]|jgi:iron complex outermembrane receptor protein
MQQAKKGTAFKKLPLFVAVLGCLYGGNALAQDEATENEPEEKKEAVQLDKITVTGSLLKRVEYDSVSPVQVITADTNIALGQVETSEFLQKSSIAAGATQISHQFGAFVTEGGVGAQTLSLRGLGPNRSLVLLNGHRPGPAGTRGQVGAFDLNVLPSSIVQRIELLKDGSSSIYGSDAVAGVANVITRKNITSPEISVSFRAPFFGGGEVINLSGATGWNFDNGSITLAGEYYKQSPLTVGDRDFLKCAEDLVWDQEGNRIDREDRSILAGTPLGGCTSGNLYANTVSDLLTGARYVPTWNGQTIGNIPGYRPRVSTTYANSPQASYTDVLNFPFFGEQYVIQDLERFSGYLSTDFSLGEVNWKTELLVNRRESEYRGFRQFFPVIVGGSGYFYANDPDFRNTATPSGVSQPVMPFRSNSSQKVDYYYVNTNFNGLFADTWSWDVNASYSRSSGTYSDLSIDASKTGDWNYGEDAPTINYFDPGFLNGTRMDELVGLIGVWDTGKTVYDQTVVTGVVTGELFNLPAGAVGAAIGAEYREFSIDDQPGFYSVNGLLWGASSAQQTKGDDSVKEVFAEVEVPLLKGLPGVESLTFNASTRWFDYDSVGDSDNVWKIGLGWQIVPSLRLRATKGTSYRAPGLYELYLGNQSAFLGQTAIDPCINWGESSNANIRANCGAAGIPDNYNGAPSSATIYQGGGAGFLTPEHSNAFTGGLIWTPEFAPVSIALDYFEIEVLDQIGELEAQTIVASCYGSDVYPNNFCSMFTRNAPNAAIEPNGIQEVYATYVNINKQKVRGYDLLVRYQDDFSFGKLTLESQMTYMKEDVVQLFDSPLEGGSTISDYVGGIGRPKTVGNLSASLERGDWTYNWGIDFVDSTRRLTPLTSTGSYTYFGHPNAVVDTKADSRTYHTVSVQYEQPKWSFLMGIRNLFNKEPDTISAAAGYNRYGNVPVSATQYDYLGVSLFARVNYKF